jgi:hypothetical protein
MEHSLLYFGPDDDDLMHDLISGCYSDIYEFNYAKGDNKSPSIDFVENGRIHGYCFLTNPPYKFEFREEGIKFDKRLEIFGTDPNEIKTK